MAKKKLKGPFEDPNGNGNISAGIHTAEGVLIYDPKLQDGMREDQLRLFCLVTERFIVVSKIDAESKFRECTDCDVLVVVYEYFASRHEGKIPKPKLAKPTTEQTADDDPNDDVLSGKMTKCSSCNSSMPVERLAFAPYCIDCQRGYEATRQSERKQGEDPNDKIKGTREDVKRMRRRNKYGGFSG